MARTFDECLTERCEELADATALIGDDGASMTYGELDRRVSEHAASLIAAGVGPGDRVVVVADNSPAHLAVAFSVWRSGATLATMYPSSGASELSYAIEASDPALVVAGTRVVDDVRRVIGGHDVPVVELTNAGTVVGLPEASSSPSAAADPDSLALICFTSGSTSRPKAVMHSHAGLLAAATSYARVWHLDERDTTLVALPLAWAFGLVTASMATLSAGGRVVVAARADPGVLLRAIASERVTFLPGVTTIFVKLVAELERDQDRDGSSLRLCISGGEPRNETVFARWRELTGCPVHDVYAASECFPVVTYDPMRDPTPRRGAAGRVVPEARLRVVGDDGADAPAGEVGEAWTRGPALTCGYWQDAALTREVLTADGWYRTGDLVRIDADGYVHVVGRRSDMILRGGANVSPAEVEAVLVQHPDVGEAAVVGLADAAYGQQVVAAVVLAAGAALDVARLRAHCAHELAGYKVPSQVVAVERLPRNAHTGKVQRREVADQLARVARTPAVPS